MSIPLCDGTKEKNGMVNFTSHSVHINLKCEVGGVNQHRHKFHENRVLLTAVSSAS